MPIPAINLDETTKERIRIAYQDRAVPLRDVVAMAGFSRASLYLLVEREGWTLRRPGRSRTPRLLSPPFRTHAGRPCVPPADAGSLEDGPDTDVGSASAHQPERLAGRLRRLLAHRIAVLEHEAARGIAVDPERNARALALNARTLTVLQRLSHGAGDFGTDDAERPPRTLAELRDELRRHLERIAEEGADPLVDRDPRPE